MSWRRYCVVPQLRCLVSQNILGPNRTPPLPWHSSLSQTRSVKREYGLYRNVAQRKDATADVVKTALQPRLTLNAAFPRAPFFRPPGIQVY